MQRTKVRRVLPGFGLSMGVTLGYLSLIVLIPLSAVFFKASTLGPEGFWSAATSPRVVASYKLSFGASLLAAAINVVFGLMLAWTLVRYSFPGRRIVDALIDLPFALPTAVAGIALTALYAQNGWLGRYLDAARHQGRLHAARRAGRAHLHRPAVRRAHGAAGAGGPRPRVRGGRRQPRRRRGCRRFRRVILADARPGAAHGLRARLRARGRRVRLGHLHRRQHADGVGDHAAASSSPSSSSTTMPARPRSRSSCWSSPSSCCSSSTACRPGARARAGARARWPPSPQPSLPPARAPPASRTARPRASRPSSKWICHRCVARVLRDRSWCCRCLAVFAEALRQGMGGLPRGDHRSPMRSPPSG